MGTNYEPAGSDYQGLVESILGREMFPHLKTEPPLRIRVMRATHDGEDDKPALAKDGLPVVWELEIVKQKLRALGAPDVLIAINIREFDELEELEQEAEMAKALFAIVPQYETDKETGKKWLKTDDSGRPVVKIRRPDAVIRVYTEIAERFGEASPEMRSIRAVAERIGQRLFDFAR